MKLRNKKTGEIKSIEEIIRDAFLSNELDSLKNIDANWEDVEEPLIKDEKIRKAVRAWAEANKFDHLIYWSKRDETYFSFMDGKTELEIMFNNPYGIIGLKDDRNYTIAELCGEED